MANPFNASTIQCPNCKSFKTYNVKEVYGIGSLIAIPFVLTFGVLMLFIFPLLGIGILIGGPIACVASSINGFKKAKEGKINFCKNCHNNF